MGKYNPLDWNPMEYRCVIRLDSAEEVTQGGLIIIQATQDSEQMAQVYGTLTQITDMAFSDVDGNRWKCEIPEVGDSVMIAKYSGFRHVREEDGKNVEYRFINDKDIVAFKKGEAENE